MAQILLLEDDATLRTIIKLNLMKSLGCDVIEKDNHVDALSILQILPNIELIICKDIDSKKLSANIIEEFLIENNYSVPLLFIGDRNLNYKNTTVINPSMSWKVIVSAAGSLIGMQVDFQINKVNSDYVPVDSVYFLNINTTSMGCDVYIRVKKNEVEYQYIKRLHANDHFTRPDIEKYIAGGLKEFYIKKEHFPQFVNFATDQLVVKLNDETVKGGERISLNSDVFEVTKERIEALGIDSHTVEIVEEGIKSMQASVAEDNALSNFLKELQANKLSFAYAHSYLTCLILNKIIAHFDWNSAQVREKISYLAYFHDMSLRSEKLIKIHSDKDLELAELTPDEINLVKNHASASAELLDKFKSVPIGVGAIVKEHHGVKTGYGFTTHLSIAISPLSMMFMVVEEFSTEFLKINGNPKKEDLAQILTKLEVIYNKTTYALTVGALRNMILNKKS